jgi:hypothetical protein
MATILERLNEKISSLGITIGELPTKTQRKIAELKRLYECKLTTVRDKETGAFTPKSKEKIQDLIEDIIADAEAFADVKNESTPPPAPKPNDPPQPPTPKPNDGPPVKKKSGLFDYLFD